MPGTLEDLGNLVKQKYPAYQNIDSAELGRRVQAKYPDAYSGYADAQAGASQAGSSPDDPGAPDAMPASAPAAPPAMPARPMQPMQPMSMPGPGAGSPSGSGFGSQVALTPPPIVGQGLFMPSEERRRSNAIFDAQQKMIEAQFTAQAQRAAQAGQLEDVAAFNRKLRQQTLDDLRARGVKLSPREEASLLAGMNITPEKGLVNIAGTTPGDKIVATIDAFGEPIDHDPSATYRARQNPETRETEWYPVSPSTTKTVEPDKNSTTGWSTIYRTRNGAEVSRVKEAPPPAAFVPQTVTENGTTMTTQQITGPDGRLETVQVPTPRSTTSTRTRTLPGQPAVLPPPPGQSKTTAPAAPAGTSGPSGLPAPPGLPSGSRVIGTPPAQQKEDIQNPLTPAALNIVYKTKPQVLTLDRLEKALEPYKNSTTPLTTFLPRIAYAMGFSSDQKGVNELLSNLEMTNITSAASALSGSTRAGKFLEQAMIHTPDTWKDSGKLMYDKVHQVRQRLQDILDVAQGPEGQRFPGLTRPPAPTNNGRPPLEQFHK